MLPDVPVRRWALSLPHRVRYALAWDHELCKQVVGALLREVARHLQGRARAHGLVDPRGGGVAIVQRFGGALNLNVHVHALVLDGVFARGCDTSQPVAISLSREYYPYPWKKIDWHAADLRLRSTRHFQPEKMTCARANFRRNFGVR